jgi:hypothetical protein
MDTQSTLFNVMALVTWTLQVAILIGMHKRRLTREFRVFFAYTVFTLCLGVLDFFLINSFGFRSQEYFIAYWLGFAVHIVLMFFVIQEVYAKVLYRYKGLRALSSMIFRWAFMLLVVLAIANGITAPPATHSWLYNDILKVDQFARIVEFGLIVLLFAFARTLALGWRDCSFGIAVGICFYCSTQLAVMSLRTHYGDEVALLVAFLTPILSIITLGLWTAYMYRAEHKLAGFGTIDNPQLEEWNRAVLQFLNRP